ncbi:hypothetical protein J4Q44_G00361790 [Coregonus suidteri]|uniref:Uncharacterized protein n=1 Tax=Coregonus suidteri TaxID=861788 RepID=A0AAN8QEU6_9TELE
MAEYKQCSYSLRKGIKLAKHQYRDKVESQFNSSDTRRMWQGLQTITDYKWKSSHVVNTDVSHPDKLNTFFARFEDNTVPPTQPTTKDSTSPWLTYLEDVAVASVLIAHHLRQVWVVVHGCGVAEQEHRDNRPVGEDAGSTPRLADGLAAVKVRNKGFDGQ